MEVAVYSLEGKKAGNITLPEAVFNAPWNADLVKQVSDSLMSTKRKNVAHTKTRGEVRGGGKKPWQQKGTGRARHGSTRSPIWVGGGITHGPRNDKNFDRTVSKKMKAKALYVLLSQKLRDDEVMFVDEIRVIGGKTKTAISALKNLPAFAKRKNAIAIAMSSKDKETERAFKNLNNVEMVEARNLDLLTLLQYKYLLIENPDVSIKALPKLSKDRKKK